MSENAHEPWAQEVWDLFRKHRGAFGPIVEKDVESAFFSALATGVEIGDQRAYQRLRNESKIAYGPAIGLSGPPPWKVEDAFEVWLRRKFPGVRNPGGALVFGLEDEVKAAFLAGAKYGAAAGSETTHSENRTDAASLGGDVASVGAGTPGIDDPERGFRLPLGDTGECGENNPTTTMKDAEKCVFPRRHNGAHSWSYKHTCLASRSDVDLSVRAFCGYRAGHDGKHSWEEGQRATGCFLDEVSRITAEVWDNTPNGGAFTNPDMTYSQEHYRQKPPLGVMPKKFWMEGRARDLSAAINRYIETGNFTPAVDEWIRELEELWTSI